MATQALPAAFKGLEPFLGWALPTQGERYEKRLSSTMEEIQAFYDAILPRMDDLIGYVNQFPLDNLPDSARPLVNLGYAFMDTAAAVELFGQPSVPKGFDARRVKYTIVGE